MQMSIFTCLQTNNSDHGPEITTNNLSNVIMYDGRLLCYRRYWNAGVSSIGFILPNTL